MCLSMASTISGFDDTQSKRHQAGAAAYKAKRNCEKADTIAAPPLVKDRCDIAATCSERAAQDAFMDT